MGRVKNPRGGVKSAEGQNFQKRHGFPQNGKSPGRLVQLFLNSACGATAPAGSQHWASRRAFSAGLTEELVSRRAYDIHSPRTCQSVRCGLHVFAYGVRDSVLSLCVFRMSFAHLHLSVLRPACAGPHCKLRLVGIGTRTCTYLLRAPARTCALSPRLVVAHCVCLALTCGRVSHMPLRAPRLANWCAGVPLCCCTLPLCLCVFPCPSLTSPTHPVRFVRLWRCDGWGAEARRGAAAVTAPMARSELHPPKERAIRKVTCQVCRWGSSDPFLEPSR